MSAASSTSAGPPSVAAVRLDWTNRFGLTASRFAARCPQCGHRRVHLTDGERRCACGQHYRLIVTAAIS